MSLSAASLEFYSKGQWDSLQPSSEGRLPLCQTHHLSHVLLDMYSTCFYIQQCQLSLLTSAIAAQITRLIILMLHLKRQLFSLDQQPTCRNGDPSLFAVKSQDFPWPSVEKKTKQTLKLRGLRPHNSFKDVEKIRSHSGTCFDIQFLNSSSATPFNYSNIAVRVLCLMSLQGLTYSCLTMKL